ATARRLDGLRIARLGVPMSGYDHVGLDPAEAEASGMTLVDIPLAQWSAGVTAVTREQIEDFFVRLPARMPPDTQWLRTPDHDRAARIAIALQALAEAEAIDCGSLSCRGPFGV